MLQEAILHIPLSNYAHALDEKRVLFRIRCAKDDIKSCAVYYSDRAAFCQPIEFFLAEMELVASDRIYDYYETIVEIPFSRICYCFLLNDGEKSAYYYSDRLTDKLSQLRSEYYQLPFNRREDIVHVPEWVKKAVIYIIYPDSFATSKRFISKEPKLLDNAFGEKSSSKNGGTLKGIAENLDYIKSLGINCLYLNPVFTAGEWHKYDTIDYFSIDPCFGTNDDFRDLVNKCHENDIKILLDGVFNHCGWKFFAFKDVIKNGEKSKYKNWFYDIKFPISYADEKGIPSYACFAYEKKMPKLNTSNPEVVKYFTDVCKYWITEFDIDGWRLDVANEINYDFWRTFRKAAKSVKPDAFLIGEIWEPAQAWLGGDMFDSAMNYEFRRNCRDFFATGELDSAGFDERVTQMRMRYSTNIFYCQLNLLDSHDVSRFYTVCGKNIDRYILSAVFQMTFIGPPSLFYGDEKYLSGETELGYRQPMNWEHDGGMLTDLYKSLIKLRRSNDTLTLGTYKTVSAESGSGIYIFERRLNENIITIALNCSSQPACIGNYVNDKSTVLLQKNLDKNMLTAWGFAIIDNSKL
ncbi:MAG: alpha-glycosidase [Ruminococcaceae bacterium]|nr:alpha-glycosidase [Oscillospiraceae bacterium]